MNTNLKLNSSLSFNALTAKARRAAALAEAVKGLEPAAAADGKKSDRRPRGKKKAEAPKPEPLPIDLKIKSVVLGARRLYADGYDIVVDRKTAGSACHAMICVYSSADLIRQRDEADEHKRAIARGADPKTLRKPFVAAPVVRYALYPAILNRKELGSVAIYSDNAFATKALFATSGSFYGFSIKKATIEMGRRPFVDLTLAV